MSEYLIIIAGYAFLGGALKYIDQAYDEKVFSKKTANIVAVFCILVMGYLMVTDAPSMMIFLGLVIALMYAQKIDNPAFYMGTAGVIPIPLIFNTSLSIGILPLSVLVLTGIMDEKGNDLADRKKIKGLLRKFFDFRCAMKLGVLGLCISGIFSFIYFIAFMIFDLMYYLVYVYSTTVATRKVPFLNYMYSLIKF